MARTIGVSKNSPKSEVTPLGTKPEKKARTKKPGAQPDSPKPSAHDTTAATASSVESTSGNSIENSSIESSTTGAITLPAPPVPAQKGKHMSLVLHRGKIGKSGKKALFTSPALRRGIAVPAAIFAGGQFPETLSLDGDNFVTLGEEEQKKAEERNAKRAAKGLKPKATPQERAQLLAARQAKLEAKLKRAQEASAKLAKRLGDVPTQAAPAASEGASASA